MAFDVNTRELLGFVGVLLRTFSLRRDICLRVRCLFTDVVFYGRSQVVVFIPVMFLTLPEVSFLSPSDLKKNVFQGRYKRLLLLFQYFSFLVWIPHIFFFMKSQ